MVIPLQTSDSLSVVRSYFSRVSEDCWFLYVTTTQIFQFPWLITMSIAATQMYRSLDDFFSSDMYGFIPSSLLDTYCVPQKL